MKVLERASGYNGRLLYAYVGPAKPVSSSGTVRDVRCETRVKGITMNYSEEWRLPPSSTSYEMHHSNLHLDITKSANQAPEEVLALHCEPKTKGGQLSAAYRRGPHLHLLMAGSARALSKSHIPLCLMDAEQRCSDVTEFTAALKVILAMIDHEVLPCLGDG